MISKTYTLVEKIVPEFRIEQQKDGQKIPKITSYGEAGGIKLVYRLAVIDEKKEPILWGLINASKKNTISETEVVLVKPFKKHISRSKEECPKNMWGPILSPFSNVWIELPMNYKNWQDIFARVSLNEVKEHVIISHANKLSNKFRVTVKEDKVRRPSYLELIASEIFYLVSKPFKK